MLAKLRCSNHCLLIETGRHNNTDVSDHNVSVNSSCLHPPGGDSREFVHPFCPAPRGFTYKFVPWGPWFRRGQIFLEMNENLLNIFIFRGCFQEAIRNGRKNSRFCLRKLQLSPRISLLNQLKE